MVDAVTTFLGLGALSGVEFVTILFVATVLAMLVGLMIESLGEQAGFGVSGNAAIFLAATAAGITAYAKLVAPLRAAPASSMLAIAVGSAVVGFLALSAARRAIER